MKLYDVLCPDRKFLRSMAGNHGVERWIDLSNEDIFKYITKHIGPIAVTKDTLSLLPSRKIDPAEIGQPHIGKPFFHQSITTTLNGGFVLSRSFGLDHLILSFSTEE